MSKKDCSKVVYAKVGTIPMLVMLDGRCKPRVGKTVRVRTPGSTWERMMVDSIGPENRLFLSR